jgi:hypothetical protein
MCNGCASAKLSCSEPGNRARAKVTATQKCGFERDFNNARRRKLSCKHSGSRSDRLRSYGYFGNTSASQRGCMMQSFSTKENLFSHDLRSYGGVGDLQRRRRQRMGRSVRRLDQAVRQVLRIGGMSRVAVVISRLCISPLWRPKSWICTAGQVRDGFSVWRF